MLARLRPVIAPALLILLVLLTIPFGIYSANFGGNGLSGQLDGLSRFQIDTMPVTNASIFAHMLAGALVTCLAPLQLIGAIRRRWPRLHRLNGYILIVVATLTAIGGLVFISNRGTIGGPLMNMGFTLYGGLMLLSAIQAMRHARARRFDLHMAWALRLFVLAIGSWLYRVHYGLWYALTGGAASTAAFTGLFDQIQMFAFYLPYLALLEIWLQRRGINTFARD
ncbi:DUF2306 domain-containing protein [Thalassococcus sp. S3]|uniref:DUF2306 domain-containing protein n=1 Tax=Thalassococcus sp. S3 TaxID=2017482 RepID=UPI0010243BBC|nr:DUF2306 domain-containing protein [Thalassococcus sp. S3]QBF34089.1 hypothetical protein CFI11_23185 [Thalassococcus sp. S3]